MNKSMLELITAQQFFSSHVCNAVITSTAFGFILLAKRHSMTKQASKHISFS